MFCEELSGEGHCACQREALVEKSCQLLEIEPELSATAIDAELKEGNLIADLIEGQSLLYLSSLHKAERVSLSVSCACSGGNLRGSGVDVDKAIPWVEAKAKIELSRSQKKGDNHGP